MTSTEMLTQVRTLLDEESEGFYEDSEIYSALTNGQKQVVNFLVTQFEILRKQQPDTELPEALNEITDTETIAVATGSLTANLPSLYLHSVAVKYTPDAGNIEHIPCYERKNQPALYFKQESDLLSGQTLVLDSGSTVFKPYYTIRDSDIFFEIAGQTNAGEYIIIFIKNPTDMTALVQPVLPNNCHDAMVKYATAFMLQKDTLLEQSQQIMNGFTQILPTLYY